MPNIDADVLAFVESVPGIDQATESEVRHYMEVGEHGIALTQLVGWAVRSRASTDVAARLERLLKVGGFAEDVRELRRYTDELRRAGGGRT